MRVKHNKYILQMRAESDCMCYLTAFSKYFNLFSLLLNKKGNKLTYNILIYDYKICQFVHAV